MHKLLQIAPGLGNNSAGSEFLSGCEIALLNYERDPIESFQNITLSAVRVCGRFGKNLIFFPEFHFEERDGNYTSQ